MVQYQKGPVCGVDNCRSKRYYEDSGLLFCDKGHRREVSCSIRHPSCKSSANSTSKGEILTQPGEDEFASQGRKTTRQREVQEAVSRVYSGAKATELFLQSYQLILRKQCWALIRTHHMPAELETVVKDLWELRIQLLKDRLKTTADAEEVFSSQPQTDTEGEEGGIPAKEKRWDIRSKQMPKILETLSICYIGAAVLRLPIGLGDFHRWLKTCS